MLNLNCGPLWRYAALLRSCSSLPPSSEDEAVLERHGFRAAALGGSPAPWTKKYAADTLRFIEFERTALPCALLRSKGQDKTSCSYLTADMDARSVMEQRIQSLVCAFSLVSRARQLSQEGGDRPSVEAPLVHLPFAEAVDRVWALLSPIPLCIAQHILDPASKASQKLKPNDRLRVQTAVDDIQRLLDGERPRGPCGLQSAILAIRKQILKIEDVSTLHARLKLLGDVLVLWAQTANFSCARKSLASRSPSISVSARELGGNVPSSILREISRAPDASDAALHPNNGDQVVTSSEVEHPQGNCGEAAVTRSPGVASMHSDGSAIDETATSVAELSAAASRTLKPQDLVYSNAKEYGPYFVFWQLMSWFNAGSDKQEEPPDLFGCVVLPPPEACFGRSAADYKDDRRKHLISILGDEKKQMLSWCQPLKECFNSICLSRLASQDTDLLFGSPMLDVALGNADAIRKVREELLGEKGNKCWTEADHTQFDSILPPEKPTAWVQCDACSK